MAEEHVTVVIALCKAADTAAGVGFWVIFILAFFISCWIQLKKTFGSDFKIHLPLYHHL
jgi:hypothetical protein